jgi:AGZA family xanthine/uracil permease-like MFS transporter
MLDSKIQLATVSGGTLRERLEDYFEFTRLGTAWSTEILAGFTTFVTMAYIVFVNPAILADAGMPVAATTAATCLAAGFASILMGAFARYPIALAPGMGLNAYFTYTVVGAMNVPWPTALGAVFLSGLCFFLLTAAGIRQTIVRAIPAQLYGAVAAGIGLFIAFVGLRNAGIVVANKDTLVALGDLTAPGAATASAGVVLTAALLAWRVKGAMLLGVLAAAVIAIASGQAAWTPRPLDLGALRETAMKLDIRGALALGGLEIVFVFLFVDLFDNLGTLLAVGKRARLFTAPGEIPRVGRILYSDAAATAGGALLGTSTVVSYIESAAGVAAGGRSGVTAIVTGFLFLIALFAAPLVGAIPAAATAPALIVVGSLMAGHAAEIEWNDPEAAIPSFLTMVAIPLTFSIANGIALGFLSFALIKIVRGRWRDAHWFLYVLAALFLARFVFLGAG